MSRLVPDDISRVLPIAIGQIAHLVEQRVVIGAVFGLALRGPGQNYHVNVAGSLFRNPTFARGVVMAIDDELYELVHSQADAHTTMRGEP